MVEKMEDRADNAKHCSCAEAGQYISHLADARISEHALEIILCQRGKSAEEHRYDAHQDEYAFNIVRKTKYRRNQPYKSIYA